MIEIPNKKDCTGCHACYSVCGRRAITMRPDEEGFLYPMVNRDLCIDCGACESVCPSLNKRDLVQKIPQACYAAQNPQEEIRLQSSSGGIFSLIAENVIREGGVVFGARWEESFNVVHDYTDFIDGLAPFRGSKYVQSSIGDSFIKAKDFLKEDRQVLFSGTPCQIAGLKRFLGRDYDNLLTVDIACHGVPSPKVWQAHLKYLGKGRKPICVNMRDKKPGWKSYSISYQFEGGRKVLNLRVNDPYMCGYLAGLYSRPSCHDCPMKPNRSQSDFTLADFWGITQLGQKDDDKGTNLVIVNSNKGLQILKSMNVELIKFQFEDITTYNPSLSTSSISSGKRPEFWRFCIDEGIGKAVDKYGKSLRPTWDIRMKMFIVNLLHR